MLEKKRNDLMKSFFHLAKAIVSNLNGDKQ